MKPNNAKQNVKSYIDEREKQVGVLVMTERGTLVTADICFNALWNDLPPLLVIPRKKLNPLFEMESPPETVIACHLSGRMQSDIYVTRWFHHFLRHTKPTGDDPVLLSCDDQTTRTLP